MIWKQRNQMVFEQMVMKLKEVVQLAVEQVEERWNVMGWEVRVGTGFRHVQNQNEKWSRPKEEWIKVNFDRACVTPSFRYVSTYQYSIQRTNLILPS